jgi:hypothetical protein
MADHAWKRTFKIKNFTGEDEEYEWRVWSSKMLVLAHKKGYYKALVTGIDSDLPEEEEKNREAVSDLTIACDGEAWEIMHNLESEERTVHEMWLALQTEFQPKEIDDYIDLTTQFKE